MGWVPPSIARKKLQLDTEMQGCNDNRNKIITKGRFRLLPSEGDMYVKSPYSSRVKFALDDKVIRYEPCTDSICGDSSAAYDATTMDEINCALYGQDPNYGLLGRKRHDRLKTFVSRWRARKVLQAFKDFKQHRIALKNEFAENSLREVGTDREDEQASCSPGHTEENGCSPANLEVGSARARLELDQEMEDEGITSCSLDIAPFVTRWNSLPCNKESFFRTTAVKIPGSQAGDLSVPLCAQRLHRRPPQFDCLEQHGDEHGFDSRSRVLRPRVYSDTVSPKLYTGHTHVCVY